MDVVDSAARETAPTRNQISELTVNAGCKPLSLGGSKLRVTKTPCRVPRRPSSPPDAQFLQSALATDTRASSRPSRSR